MLLGEACALAAEGSFGDPGGLELLFHLLEAKARRLFGEKALEALALLGRELDGRPVEDTLRSTLSSLARATGGQGGLLLFSPGGPFSQVAVGEGAEEVRRLLGEDLPSPAGLEEAWHGERGGWWLWAGGFGEGGLMVLYGREPFSLEARLLAQATRDRLLLWARDALYLEGLARALGKLAEGLDPDTHGHMERVARLAEELGRAAGFPDLRGLRVGAYLHDLGKLLLPKELLGKEGALNTGEWRLVKTHPEAGFEALKEVPFFPRTALNVVLHHHERWDGSGYPRGLKGEEIPLEARIFAVVDVWDALVSRRPYKRAWTREEASRELWAQAGRALDPLLVDLFLSRVLR